MFSFCFCCCGTKRRTEVVWMEGLGFSMFSNDFEGAINDLNLMHNSVPSGGKLQATVHLYDDQRLGKQENLDRLITALKTCTYSEPLTLKITNCGITDTGGKEILRTVLTLGFTVASVDLSNNPFNREADGVEGLKQQIRASHPRFRLLPHEPISYGTSGPIVTNNPAAGVKDWGDPRR